MPAIIAAKIIPIEGIEALIKGSFNRLTADTCGYTFSSNVAQILELSPQELL